MPKKNDEVDFEKALNPMQSVQAYSYWIHSVYAPYIGKRMLEIGAGTGNQSVFYMKDVDYALCTDIDPKMAELHAERFKNLKNCETRELGLCPEVLEELQEKKFDTVLSVNVLEHIEDDAGMVRMMRDVVVPGGRVIIFVPALSRLYSEVDEKSGHYRRYDKGQLKALAQKAGMACEMDRYFNFFGIPIFYLFGKRNKKGGDSYAEVLSESTSPLINTASHILRPLEKLIHPPIGVSEVIVMRKEN